MKLVQTNFNTNRVTIFVFLLALLSSLFISHFSFGQGTNCVGAQPFCTDAGAYSFPNTTNNTAEVGPNYGCLMQQPNPAWYFCKIKDPGDITIKIKQRHRNIFGIWRGIDVDFICWGPFNSLDGACDNLFGSNTIDCSFSTSATEYCNIVNAQTGEYYLLLLTNYSNRRGEITFEKSGGLGTTDCCAIDADPKWKKPLGMCINSASVDLKPLIKGKVGGVWNGVGTSSSGMFNPTVAGVGIHKVFYKVTNGLCTDSMANDIEVFPLPQPDFTTNTVCLGDSTSFTNTTTITTGTIKTYNWKFTNAVNPPGSSLQNPKYKYPTCNAPFIATLTVVSDSGCIDTKSDNVNVSCLPVANFTVANACQSDSIPFTNNSTSASNYQWDFETVGATIDNTSNSASPKNYYTTSGTYLVSLIANNIAGCKDTAQKSVTIFPMPIAAFTAPNVCFNDSTLFASTSSVGVPDNITNYAWDFNNDNIADVNGATITSPHIKYATTYTDSASLTVTTNNGCKNKVKEKITIYPLPLAKFTAPNVCLGNVTNFNNQSSIVASSSISSYDWNLVTSTSNLKNPAVTYLSENNYAVLLTVLSNFGCKDTEINIVKVYPLPIVSFNVDKQKGCQPLCVNFSDASSISTNPIVSTNIDYKWLLGNGDSLDTQNSNYCYEQSGIFDVTLNVASNYGCTSSLTKPGLIEVYPKPTANFYATPIKTTINNPIVTAIDSSKLANIIEWNFGDNTKWLSSTLLQQNYTYKDSGTYIITQIATTSMGCKDTMQVKIYMGPDRGIFVPNAFTPNGDGKNDYFNAKFYGIKEYELIIFNRWGETVCKITDMNSPGWDGTNSRTNDISEEGVYNWQLEYVDVFNKRGKSVGTITLVK